MSKFKKKPWRRFPRRFPYSRLIRSVCCVILVLELAFFTREMFGGGWYRTACVLETETWTEAVGETEAGADQTYGIRIRIKDGEIDFYKKETLKSTN